MSLTLTFGEFAKGNYEEGERNLYIIWRGKQCLYIGVSIDDIWIRWFHRNNRHISIVNDDAWLGSSPIGRVIVYNLPKSLRWKIELREIPLTETADLQKAEKQLIRELRPLFNITHRQPLTPKENRLAKRLLNREIQSP